MADDNLNAVNKMKNWSDLCEKEKRAGDQWVHQWGPVFFDKVPTREEQIEMAQERAERLLKECEEIEASLTTRQLDHNVHLKHGRKTKG